MPAKEPPVRIRPRLLSPSGVKTYSYGSDRHSLPLYHAWKDRMGNFESSIDVDRQNVVDVGVLGIHEIDGKRMRPANIVDCGNVSRASADTTYANYLRCQHRGFPLPTEMRSNA